MSKLDFTPIPLQPGPMEEDDLEVKLIKGFEGYRPTVYDDGVGNATVGYGSKVTGGAARPVTEPQATELLKSDIAEHESYKAGLTKPIPKEMEAALTSLAFNVGAGHRGVRAIVNKINAGDYEGAADQFLLYDAAKDQDTGEYVELPGLRKRREQERALFLAGVEKLAPSPRPKPGELSFTPIDVETATPAPPAERESDILGAVKRGVELSFTPFTVDAEDVTKPKTTAEIVAETAANVGTDIASSIAVGALAGSAVAPIAGTAAGAAAGTVAGLGLGIYRALGYESLMSRAKGEAFNPLRAGINVLVEVNPLLKVGGRALKFGTQGALQALQTLAYGGSGEAAAVSGLIGGTLGAAGHLHGKAPALDAEQKLHQVTGITTMLADPELGPQDLQRIATALDDGDESFQIARRAYDMAKVNKPYEDAVSGVVTRPDFFDDMGDSKRISSLFDSVPDEVLSVDKKTLTEMKDMVRAELKRDGVTPAPAALDAMVQARAKQTIMEQEAGSFARWITRDYSSELGPELFQQAKKKLSTSSLDAKKAYDIYRTQHYLKDAATEAASKAAQDGTGIKDPLGLSVFRFFSDLKFASRAVDRTAGTNIDGLTDAVAYRKHQHGAFMYGITKKTNTLLKQAKKIGLDRGTIVDLLESGANETHASAAHREVLQGFRDLFDEMREFGVKNGIDIGLRKNYVTHVAQEPAELITVIRRRAVQYENSIGKVRPEALTDNSLHKVLEHITGVTVAKDGVADPQLIRRALNKLDSLETIKDQDGFEAIAAFQRKGEIPDFVREKDIGKIMIRYGNNLSKSVHMEPVIRMLQAQVPALEAMGLDQSAGYLKRYIGHISGKQSEFIGWTNASKTRWKTSIDEFIDKSELTGLALKGLNTAKLAPDFISWSMALIYPNYLGLSAKAVLRNWTQPLMMTAPELGGSYGYKLTMKATMETIQDRKAGVHLENALRDMGHVPGEHIGEGLNPIANSLRSTTLGPFVTKVDEVGKVMMWAYAKSDAINRYVTMKVAKTLAKDMLEGMKGGTGADHQAAMRVLKELAPGAKSTIYRLAQDGKLGNLEEVLTRYMLSKTQFNYGPHALSEYGRTMGRFFSMFTKWPAMVAGDIHELTVTKQYKRAAIRYLAPWAALGVMNQWFESTKDSPRRRALVGKSLLPISPLSSLEVSTPPSLEILGGVAKSFMHAASMDFSKAGSTLGKSLNPVIPGVGLAKGTENVMNLFLNKDAPWSKR